MAMSSAADGGTKYRKSFNVIADADADVGDHVINHNMALGAVDQATVTLEPLLPSARLSEWYISARGVNSVTVRKNAITAGSGNAAPQLRVTVQRFHSICN